MSYGITGTREGLSNLQTEWLREQLRLVHEYTIKGRVKPEFHLGDCEGVDTQAYRMIVEEFGTEAILIGHPPKNTRLARGLSYNVMREPLPYIERNHALVDEASQVWAFPHQNHEVQRSGTWATIRYALKRGKDIQVVKPYSRVSAAPNVTQQHRLF